MQTAEHKRSVQTAHYWAHRERRLAANKAWRMANKDKTRANQAKHAEVRRARTAAYMAKWRAENPEEYVARRDAWAASNKHLVCKYTMDRKARILKATPGWANKSAIEAIYEEAAWLRSNDIDVHVDHIVPLKGRTVCGLHVENNLQILPAVENKRKHNKLVCQ